MERRINLSPWKFVYLFDKYSNQTLINYATLIIQNPSDDYFYLYDDYEKILDISIMPDYIKEDWLNYNKKELNISVLNACVKDCNKKLDTIVNIEEESFYREKVELFKLLRRDLILKGLI